MFSQDISEKIKKTAHDFFQKMTFEVEVGISFPKEGVISINIKTDDPKVLIGQNGQTLFETQHLLKAMLKRKITEPFYIDLDINDYKKKKIEYLKELARSGADEVALTKKEKILAPMPAYERRVIHLELAERSDVSTESIGEEPERKIVIRPRP